MKRAALMAAAATVYLLSAWMVAPGFYDGFTPQQPYNWVCPPLHVSNNQPPASGHLDIKMIGGVSDANSAFTDDGQLVIGFLPGAFDSAGKTMIAVDIKPVSPCPKPAGLHLVTNAYVITAEYVGCAFCPANANLVKPANLVLRYSDLVPAPDNIYFATDPGGPWKSIGAAPQSQFFTIVTTTSQLGYFVAAYPANIKPPPGAVTVGGSQLLPIAVAVLIVGVVVAGIPLAIIRRRRGTDTEVDEEDS